MPLAAEGIHTHVHTHSPHLTKNNENNLFLKRKKSWAVVAHSFNPSTWEAEASPSLCIQGQPGLQSKFQDNQGYTEKPCLEKPRENNAVQKESTDTKVWFLKDFSKMRTGKIDQWEKCLSCKHEELSSDPQCPCKSQAQPCRSVTPLLASW